MNPSAMRVYMRCASQTEQRLRKSNPPQEGGLAETSWLAPCVSASFRTTPFLSERYKFDSPQLGEPVARDVVRRRWTRTTHDMYDLCREATVAATLEHLPCVLGVGLMNRFDAFDGSGRQVSNGKPQDGGDRLTDLTDLTPIEWGCTYRASAGSRAHVAPLTHLPFNCRQIRQMCQTPPAVMRFRFDARRQTRCQFDGSRMSGVVA